MKINLVSEQEVLSPDSRIVSLSGEIDIHSAPKFKDDILTLLESGCLHVVVDLDELEFMDSRGLGAFINISRAIKEKGGTLKLVCSNQTILKIFQRTGLNEIFDIFDNRALAMKE
jgi:anti-sigma B factor antagonist